MARISSMDARFFLLFCLLHSRFSSLATAANNTLEYNSTLESNNALVSANKLFELRFFTTDKYDGASYLGIWYHGDIRDNRAVWVANRENPLANGTGILTMRADGNLVISYSNGTVVWSTNVSAQSNSSNAVLEDTGNLVVKEVSSGAVLWESFDHPCDTLLPGMKIGINLRTRSTRMLTAWKNKHDPSPGIYALGIDPQDPNQFFIWRGSFPYWRLVWWNGTGFQITSSINGITYRGLQPGPVEGPYTSRQRMNESVVRTDDEVYFRLSSSPGMLRTWLALETSGHLWGRAESAERVVGNYTWSVKPEQRRCSKDGVCGPNSSCNEDEEPMCKCLPGYKPSSTADWDSGNWEDGCTSELSLECGDQDGYLTLKRVKLPVYSSSPYQDNATMCRKGCNDEGCKCRAYAWRGGDCYYWDRESVKVVEEDADEDGSNLIQPEVNIRVGASVLNNTGRRCSNCGTNTIPYPLSTGPDCGDPAYNSFHCNSSTGQLSFLAPDGSSYAVSGISQEDRTFFIKPEGLDLCWAGSSKRSDIHLNSSSPFRVTRNNTVLLLNCSSTPKNLPSLNCSASNPCYSYIQEGGAPCFYSAECCSYVAGGSGSSTLHKIGVLDSGCGSYVSMVNLDTSVDKPLWEWKERVQIEWDAPLEPLCDSEHDCDAWPNSSCLASRAEVGKKRCLCDDNFRWDQSHMNCTREGSGRGQNGKKKLFVILIATAAPGIIFSAAIIYCLWGKNRRRGKQENRHDTVLHFGTNIRFNQLLEVTNRKGNLDLPLIDFECLVEATDNFSNSNKLGEGGFGPVYKGTLSGGQEIAVKRLSRSSGQGLEEFENEVVLIAKLQHRNLVRMLGYCIEGSEKMLVYEYLPNKSLNFFLFDATRRSMLDWEKRINIIMGITRGLLYLHQDSRLRIIHRDLKTSNILLDKDMNPKISDFGMARIFGGNQTQDNTNRVVGTYGYISPEYAANGLFSVKSDAYSFGIIILEIIAGKKNSYFSKDENASSLAALAWQLWKEERGLELMDPSLRETCDPTQVLKCIHLGLLCVQENATDRPTMSSVLVMLESETASLPAPNQPAFFRGCLPAPPTSSCPGRIPGCSGNTVTISTMEGR